MFEERIIYPDHCQFSVCRVDPIEPAWSKFKQFLRTAKARAAGALDQAITQALKTMTAENAAGWFRHCGYSIQKN
jgi:hypothetical protein